MTFVESLSKVLPIILLFLLGLFLNRRRIIRPETVTDLRTLVIKLTLPAALFLAFSSVNLEARHLLIFAAMFGSCVLALWVGRAIRPVVRIESPTFRC